MHPYVFPELESAAVHSTIEARRGHRSKQRGGQARSPSDKGWGGGESPISRRKGGGGTLFLSWEKENCVESSVKRSILTTFVAAKAQKRLKLALTIYLDLF
jgi:hypothetical protein